MEEKITAIHKNLEENDLEKIKESIQDLQNSLTELYQLANQQEQQEAPTPETGSAEGDTPRSAKGKVVDADVVDEDEKTNQTN